MNKLLEIKTELIKRNPEQPRKTFDEKELKELSESIKENGIILPISVYESGGEYYLIDGERRLMASRMVGLSTIPAYVRKSENDSGLLATIANIQRSDLTPIEEGMAYKSLVDKMSIVKVSKKIGKSIKTIADRIEILKLEDEIKELIDKRLLPTDNRAVKALLSIDDSENRIKIAQKLARPGLRIKTVITACEKFNSAIKTTMNGEHVPALYYSAIKQGSVNLEKWNLLKQINSIPPWNIVKNSAVDLCDRCPLRETASKTVCGDCPAVLLVSLLIKKVNDEH